MIVSLVQALLFPVFQFSIIDVCFSKYFTQIRTNLCHLSHPVVDPDGDLAGGLPVVHLGEVERGMVLELPLRNKY